MMGGWYGGGMGVGVWMIMGLFWLVLLAAIIWAVVRLLPARHGEVAPGRETPEDILDRRFARGEIDLETYQAQRSALQQARGANPGGQR